jgi:23S rRNA pseudouridine1911/1915/1917 synthase
MPPQLNSATTATATKSDRLDKTVAALFPQISRSAAQRLIDQRRVQVNSHPRDASFRVNRGDLISIQLPEATSAAPQPEAIQLNVLYEDDDVIAINKSAGMVVHPAAGNPSGTLVNAMLAHAPDLLGVGDEHRPGIVHRLDKETSGILLVAKTDVAYKALQDQFKARTIKKTYLALCVGNVQPDRGRINKPIARDPSHRQRMAVVAGGREAVTDYAVQEVFGNYSLLRLHPQTGRTHQIRVHLASIGFPLVGDGLYGATKRDALSKRLTPRHMLHASELSFEQPSSRKAIKLYAPIPEDMSSVIAELAGSD